MMTDRAFNNWTKIALAIPKGRAQAVKKVALDVQAEAQATAPVDTGFLRNSIYTVTSEGSTYQGGAKALPEIQRPPDDQTAYVAVGASYGVYIEYGTRYQSAQPFLTPAMEHASASFDAALTILQDVMGRAANEH